MPLQFYNTLTRQKEIFKPMDGKTATLYHCGPTVYHYAHIGNLRAFIFADILRRTIEMHGYDVKQIMNITDVGHLTSDTDAGEDKLEKGARREGKTAKEVADFFTAAFFEDLKALHIEPAFAYPRATEHIPEQIRLIQLLEEKGYTYQISDGVYFDTSKFPDYGALARLNVAGQEEGARVAANPEKKNAEDFALWKFSPRDEKRQQEWWAPWELPNQENNEMHPVGSPRTPHSSTMQGAGEERKTYDKRVPEPATLQSARVRGSWGFPGWHVECSAMAMEYLGETIDIHTGGIDHIAVHHTNERAQSVCATGKPFARFWMHGGFVNLSDAKMSKSGENFIRLTTLEEHGIPPLAYRYWLLTAHYRTTIEFDFATVQGAGKALERIYSFLSSVRDLSDEEKENLPDQSTISDFKAALADDLNTSEGIAILWNVLKNPNLEDTTKKATLISFDRVLGLDFENAKNYIPATLNLSDLPENVLMLVHAREEARKEKKWKEADRLREEIQRLGFSLEDTPEGPRIEKI
ncbi:MAG TPA: cysteine--tRNA ligase [Candidatus Paceibacterota bacterium]|nr:cysteine--tRNA ligase [Candidatus Paceibacterota bacterium]